MAQVINKKAPNFINMSYQYATDRESFRKKWHNEVWDKLATNPQIIEVFKEHQIVPDESIYNARQQLPIDDKKGST
jgi:hypothetical protein